MGFLDTLNQEIAKANSGEDKVEHPSASLKHPMIYVGNKNPEVFVRILPPENHGDNYAVVIREAMLYAMNGNSKVLQPTFVLGEQEDPNSILEQYITLWLSQARMPSRLSSTTAPAQRALVNVRQIMQNPGTGNWEEEVDEFGAPVTRMLKLPISAYWAINKMLADPRYSPVGSDEYSFISELTAFPIGIKKGKGNGYEANVYANMPLPPLEEGWRNSLEDLNFQATPSVEYNLDFVNYFIGVVEGVEIPGGGQEQRGMPGNPMFPQYQQPQIPQTPQTPVPTQVPGGGVPLPQQTSVPPQTPPVTPAVQTPVTPPVATEVTPQVNMGVTPPAQVTQPVQTPPVQTPPVQTPPVQTEQPTQGTPAPNHVNTGLPSVDDLIDGM